MSSKYQQISIHFGNNKVDQALLEVIEKDAETIGISKSKYVKTILLEEYKSRVPTRIADILSRVTDILSPETTEKR